MNAGTEILWLPAHLIDQRLELVNVFKTPVNAGKANVGDLVEFLEFAHDEFAKPRGRYFPQAQVEQLFLNPFNRRIHLLGADGAFAQRQAHGAEDFAAFVLNAAAIFLDDGGEVDVRPLIGRKTFFTRAALAAPAYEVCVF